MQNNDKQSKSSFSKIYWISIALLVVIGLVAFLLGFAIPRLENRIDASNRANFFSNLPNMCQGDQVIIQYEIYSGGGIIESLRGRIRNYECGERPPCESYTDDATGMWSTFYGRDLSQSLPLRLEYQTADRRFRENTYPRETVWALHRLVCDVVPIVAGQ